MKNKLKIMLSLFAGMVSWVVMVESAFAYQYLPQPLGLTLIISSVLIFLLSLVLDYFSGNYECRHCSHRFTPTIGAYIWGMHTITKIRLKCPKCGKKSFCKKKLD